MKWIDLFEQVFNSIAEPLSVVLNATGCREGWLQGEFYRHLIERDKDFMVNEFEIAPRAKADLYGEKPSRMVAEVKVYGVWNYYQKNIDGHSNIDMYLPIDEGQRIDVAEEHINRAGSGSLLNDLIRLRKIQEDLEKYMILVIHKNAQVDRFGEAIQAIRLTQNEFTFEYPDFLVRIWEV